MKPTVLRTGCQRGVRLEIALVERRHKQKRTAAYYLVGHTPMATKGVQCVSLSRPPASFRRSEYCPLIVQVVLGR
jgi:hypothetical protein